MSSETEKDKDKKKKKKGKAADDDSQKAWGWGKSILIVIANIGGAGTIYYGISTVTTKINELKDLTTNVETNKADIAKERRERQKYFNHMYHSSDSNYRWKGKVINYDNSTSADSFYFKP